MYKLQILTALFFLTTLSICSQEVTVIDNKGTIKKVNNNKITIATIAPVNPLIGDIWFNSTTTPSVINVWNGAWIEGGASSRKVTNELIFTDTNYYYVSILIDNTSWEVYRYDKTDVNSEKKAIGTGTQPSTLVNVQALTYS